MSFRVMGDKNKAALYDGTTEETYGPVYKGYSNAQKELSEFITEWLETSVEEYTSQEISKLYVAYKVEKGFLNRGEWNKVVREVEDLLDRCIYENSI